MAGFFVAYVAILLLLQVEVFPQVNQPCLNIYWTATLSLAVTMALILLSLQAQRSNPVNNEY